MIFLRTEPEPAIAHWVECFWVIENDDAKQVTQKIIPDGFPEIIFHFGEPYEINLNGAWQRQSLNLVAGQIKKYFWLRNTGRSSMLGIKLKPCALSQVLNLNMRIITDKVEELESWSELIELKKIIRAKSSYEERIEAASEFFNRWPSTYNAAAKAVDLIFAKRGMNSVNDLAEALQISERQLERLFSQFVGLSPKFYSRLIRFSTIFQLREQGDPTWMDLTYEAGFADQSHFIRNFKSFTGEDPTGYEFDDKNMANFFMKKK